MNCSDIHTAERNLFALRRDLLKPRPDTKLHFLGRALREGEGDDAILRDSVDGDPPRDTARHDLGLAGTRTGDDKHAPACGPHRGCLARREPLE